MIKGFSKSLILGLPKISLTQTLFIYMLGLRALLLLKYWTMRQTIKNMTKDVIFSRLAL